MNLIDEDDLVALLPQGGAPDMRGGHDFHNDLGGDFARLAPFIQARLWKKGMLFSNAQLRDFLALARTHGLIVLAGDSGAGKTSLIRAVAESINGRCTVIPVKPNWTGPEDLLTIKDATVKRFHDDSHDQLRTRLADFLAAYNFARRLKTLNGLTPYEYICKIRTSETERFILNPIHEMPGLNT